jgi:hypothetical protein
MTVEKFHVAIDSNEFKIMTDRSRWCAKSDISRGAEPGFHSRS